MCIATQPTPRSAATGQSSAATSLINVAPAATAARATDSWRVSIESRTSPASAATTGTTRSSSTSGATGTAPGRVDSPPTSITSAPSAIMARARTSAASSARYLPPSEKESGVTFSTPITRGITGRNRTGACQIEPSERCSVPYRTETGVGASGTPVDEPHRLRPGGGVGAEQATDRRGDRRGAGLADATHRHAEVLRLDDHQHAPRATAPRRWRRRPGWSAAPAPGAGLA